jgi:outer membrane biosynthesis protein TonB
MKFVKLESRGGNYLVVAENVAWLRVAENGQTSVGIIGGQPLLVVGSLEEVAAKLLEATAAEDEAVAAPAPPPAADVAPAPPAPAPEPVAQAPAPEPAPPPAPPAPAAKPVAVPDPVAAPQPPRPAVRQGMTLSERIAAAAPKVKAGR